MDGVVDIVRVVRSSGHQHVDAVAQADEKAGEQRDKDVVEPTAPSAVEPANRPTTATSDMLNKTCSRLDNASGRLTRRICFASGPSVRDLVLDFMLSFSFFSPKTVPAHTGAQHLL